MTLTRAAALPALLLALILLSHRAAAQALPTATQTTHLSAFAGGTGVFTDFAGGHNLSITAGLDLSIYSFNGFHPSIEIRGTYPVHTGTIDSQKNFLAGGRIDHQYGNFRPYANFLLGRGQIDYQNGGYSSPVSGLTYISTTTNVYSPGGGVDYDFTDHFSLKADFQYQFWSTPIPTYGSIHPKVGTIALVYRFGDNHPRHHPPPPPPVTPPPPPPAP